MDWNSYYLNSLARDKQFADQRAEDIYSWAKYEDADRILSQKEIKEMISGKSIASEITKKTSSSISYIVRISLARGLHSLADKISPEVPGGAQA